MLVRTLLFGTIFLARHGRSAGLGALPTKYKKGKSEASTELRKGVKETPTESPSYFPTFYPTKPTKPRNPTVSPTSKKSKKSTYNPTSYPTGTPTDTPTHTPTAVSPGLGRFSYKANDTLGPLAWEDVDTTHNEWEVWEPMNVDKNECGKERNRQSPIDLVKNEKCQADHEMLFEDGSCTISDIGFEVTPYSLKATFPIQSCTPPALDLSDSFHSRYVNTIELKVPGEHTINGTSFDGEMQFSFVVNVLDEYKSNRDHQIAMVVRHLTASKTKDDDYMEMFLEGWEAAADRTAENCTARGTPFPETPHQLLARTQRRHRRRLRASPWSVGGKKHRKLLRQPFRNQYYYGYRGSLTVPPCSDIVLWYVVDNPMEMSAGQLRRLRHLVANYRDAQCALGTYADEGGNVNRPIQPKHKHNVFHCDESDYSN